MINSTYDEVLLVVEILLLDEVLRCVSWKNSEAKNDTHDDELLEVVLLVEATMLELDVGLSATNVFW